MLVSVLKMAKNLAPRFARRSLKLVVELYGYFLKIWCIKSKQKVAYFADCETLRTLFTHFACVYTYTASTCTNFDAGSGTQIRSTVDETSFISTLCGIRVYVLNKKQLQVVYAS